MPYRRLSLPEVVEAFVGDNDVGEALTLWSEMQLRFGRNPKDDQALIDRLHYLLGVIDEREVEVDEVPIFEEGA